MFDESKFDNYPLTREKKRPKPGEAVMKLRCFVVTVCAVVVLVPTALAAGGAADKGYGGGGNVQSEVGSGAAAGNAGTLPFTGLDLALLVVGGLALVLVGAGLRRAARRRA
jgi:hypothetical protein